MIEPDMGQRRRRGHAWTVAGIVGLVAASPAMAGGNWPQWGGPNGDFKVAGVELADSWPEGGPARLWQRPLGDGYSAIVSTGGRLYTMYRDGGEEVVIALDADTGKTLWTHRYPANTYPKQTAEFGEGPNASPLIIDDKLVTVGFTGIMHCLGLATGKVLWSHDLVRDFKGQIQHYGYANAPIAYDGTIITLVGGDRAGVMALRPEDGTPVWTSKPCGVSYAAPVLINVDGQDQVVFFSPNEVIGMNPKDGAFLWRYPVANFCRTNCTSAVWGKDNLLWAATKGVGGTRVLRLTQRNGKTDVKKTWLDRKIRVYHWNAVRIGDHVYTSTGDSSKFLAAIDIKSGHVVQKQRGFGSTNGIYADGKLLLLDDSGKLALADVSPEKIKILSSVQLLNSVTWTPPSLVGTRLFIRDRKRILALDVGRETSSTVSQVTEITSP